MTRPIYATFTTDYVTVAGLFVRGETEIEEFMKDAEAQGYEGIRPECKVVLTVTGGTRWARKQDFWTRVQDLVIYASPDLQYWEEDYILNWIETNAARLGMTKKLREAGIL